MEISTTAAEKKIMVTSCLFWWKLLTKMSDPHPCIQRYGNLRGMFEIRILASRDMGIYGGCLIMGIASWCNWLVYSTGALGVGTSHVCTKSQDFHPRCYVTTEDLRPRNICAFFGGRWKYWTEKTSKECRLQEGEILLNANLLSGNGQLVLHMPSNAMSF